MPKKVVQFDRIGLVTLSKNKRSKNIKISVKPNKKVLVSFPFFAPVRDVVAFIQKNEGWIKKQHEKFDSKKISLTEQSVIQTKLYRVTFQKGGQFDVKITDNKVAITVVDFETEQTLDAVENILVKIYRHEANLLLPERLHNIARKHGFQYSKVTIRNNKRNWGSCSSKNNISLNLQMMKLPDELIDYILLHELVHTEIKDHSPKFWKRMDELTNNTARKLAKEVKQYSTSAL
ncbi:MAG TPA: SprT family zinc-dependent metalloprotease [Prolixibacteraceae bacterium]|nr:SprT family zinc-dependent metalloprotease [Prolixibacteraceae bacterium]